MKKQYKIKSSLVLGILALLTTLGGAVAITNHQANAEGESCTAKSGTYDGVDWEITADCQLVLGKAGQTQTMTNRSSRNEASYPWNDDRANIKTATFAGQVIGQGSLMDMFRSMANLTNIENLTNLDTTNVTYMTYMFRDDPSLTSLDLSNFNTSNVRNMAGMFYNDTSLTSLDLSSFDTSNATNINSMFYGASSITNLDLSNFDTSNVTSIAWMFGGMSSLASLNISSFDTSKVTNMEGVFARSTGLTSLDLSNFDTSSVTSMAHMFKNTKLSTVDLSNFNTSNVTKMSGMFRDSAFTSLDLSSFDTSNVIDMAGDSKDNSMFEGTNSLRSITFGLGWTNWIDNAYLMTPPTDSTTGKWIKTDKSLPSKTPAELYNELPANISTYAGTWVWEMLPEEPIIPDEPVTPNPDKPVVPAVPGASGGASGGSNSPANPNSSEITVPMTGENSILNLVLSILAIMSGLSLFSFLVFSRE